MKNVSPNPGCLRLSRFENNGPNFVAPQSNRLVTHVDAAHGEQVFDVAVTEIETMVEPNRMLNDRGRKSVSFVEPG